MSHIRDEIRNWNLLDVFTKDEDYAAFCRLFDDERIGKPKGQGLKFGKRGAPAIPGDV